MSPAQPELITRAQASHELFRTILAASHDCAAVIDIDGVVLASNGLCPCGAIPCIRASLDLSIGSQVPAVLRGDVLSGADAFGRSRVVVELQPHGAPAQVEATVVRLEDPQSWFLLTMRDFSEHMGEVDRVMLLASEMRHRLGNVYSIAMAIMSASAREEDPVGVAVRRLGSLALVQDLSRGAKGMRLSDMANAFRASVDGEDIYVPVPDFEMDLDASQAQALMLVTGELCANSLKHGALLHGGGVDILWRRDDSGLVFDWIERSPVPPRHGDREGASGFRIMSSMMRTVRGSLVDEWPETGLRVKASLPVRI